MDEIWFHLSNQFEIFQVIIILEKIIYIIYDFNII